MQNGGSDVCLETLVAATKQAASRHQLVQSPLLRQLAVQLAAVSSDQTSSLSPTESASHEILQLLRILRNVCACGSSATVQLLDAEVHNHTAAMIAKPGGAAQIAQVASQLLANLSASGQAEAAAVWGACWPETFKAMAGISTGSILGPLSMILYNGCNTSEALAAELVGEARTDILLPLLEQFETTEDIGDAHMSMLVSVLCLQTGNLPTLSPQAERSPMLTNLRHWHCGVLEATTEAIERQASNHLQRLSGGNCSALAGNISNMIDLLARSQEEVSGLQSEFLRAAMQFMRTVTSADDELVSLSSGTPVTTHLVESHQLIPRMLGMLAALGPLKDGRSSRQPVKSWPACDSIAGKGTYCSFQPYKGFRTDILTVLANAAYKRLAVQNQVLELGCVELILAHCQVCEDSPFLREAALWCIRNLCEGNFAVQKQIEELQVVSTVESPELTEAGLHLQHDSATGRINVVGNIND